VRALADAISWSIDHALQDLVAIERADQADEEVSWDDLAFLNGQSATAFVTHRCSRSGSSSASSPQPRRWPTEAIGERMFACVAEELAAYLVIQEAEGQLSSLQDRWAQNRR
jgi:hypothetical protein